MASEHRPAIDALDNSLAALPEHIRACDFIAAVRRIECGYPHKPRTGDAVHVRDDVVRMSQHAGLGFQGTALYALEPARGAQELRLYCNFFGLLGSNGPMPLHFTEYAQQRTQHHADPAFREFLDLFNHRMLSLFYKASTRFDPAVSFDRADDNAYDDFVGALCGLMAAASRQRDTISDSVKRHYPGWFASSAKSPDGIVALLSDYFDLPVAVKEWVGGWLPLPKDSLARLGSGTQSVQLGQSLYIGRQVWSIRHRFRIQVGPVDWQTFSSFKPGGPRARSLHDLVRHYLGDEWDWDLELRLLPHDIARMALNRKNALGFDSCLRSAAGKPRAAQSVVLNKRLLGQIH